MESKAQSATGQMSSQEHGRRSLSIGSIISIFALFASIASVVITMTIFKQTKRMNMYQLNIELLYESQKLIKDDDSLLLLHGIDPEEIRKDGISNEEFYYILSSLTASEAFFILNNNAKQLSIYRTQFLQNKKVELVYKKYLRNRLISFPVFITLVDEFYSNKNKPDYFRNN